MFTMGTFGFYHVLCNQIWNHFLPQYELHPIPNLFPCILLRGLIFVDDYTNILFLIYILPQVYGEFIFI
jgi:hypothetical protein